MKNEIILGNCFDVMKNLDDDSFDVSFTSPPYNRVRDDTYKHFDDIDADYLQTLCDLSSELIRITRKDVIINVQQNMYNKVEFFTWLGKFSNKIKGVVIWGKNNPQPAINYRKSDETFSVTNAFEYFVVMGKENKEFRANNKIKNVITTNVNSDRFDGHGAVMKFEVADFFIKNFTKKNDLILDPFFGCGTTGIACIKNKRNYLGIELVEEYKNIAQRRIKHLLNQPDLFDFDYNEELK